MRNVFIISDTEDIHACAVYKLLKEVYSAQVCILDTSKIPIDNNLTVSWKNGKAIGHFPNQCDFTLTENSSVWWRRPKSFTPAFEVTDARLINFIKQESRTTFEGLIEASYCKVTNSIYSEKRANNKAFQLSEATKVGFNVPKTIITNDKEDALYFINSNANNVIYKPQTDAKYHLAETRMVDEQFFSRIELLKLSPIILQQYIPAEYDLRITVIGNEAFTTQILSQDGQPKIDWRIDLKVPMKKIENNIDIVEKCILLTSNLGLSYGAIDLRVTPDNEVFFFEINPSGQFLFCEEDDKLPITNALCKWLIDE
jgi:glutathione synthase/RimK-type ligase-like ATP-grasp enzyme